MALLEKGSMKADGETFCFDLNCQSDLLARSYGANESNRTDIMKKYLVYLELPKIRIGDYRRSSCISGDVLRFHFLLKIAQDEARTILQMVPIKEYKVPVVNFAVMHRSLLEDDEYKGPIPKSPDVKSPLICYDSEEVHEAIGEEIADDFRSSQRPLVEEGEARPKSKIQEAESTSPTTVREDSGELSSCGFQQSEDLSSRSTRQKRPKKYFVYCEIPKVLIGDYRKSSVICSDIIHAHFLMKIAIDEERDQPQLYPIRRYHRPRVNFAVIHRSLMVDDEAIGPIARSPRAKSPMIKEDEDNKDDDTDEGSDDRTEAEMPIASAGVATDDEVLHATMGFCYGRLPRSKYELISQWSLIPGSSGVTYPELVLSKAEA